MDERKREIQKENKRALPRFLLILLAAVVVGVCLSLGLRVLEYLDLSAALVSAGNVFTSRVAPWGLWLCVVLVPAAGVPMYLRCRGRAARWNGEDETEADAIDRALSICLWVSNAIMILSLLFAAASFSGLMHSVEPGMALFCSVGLMLSMLAHLLYQQKVVDLTRRLYPEKEGSVYDMRFQKKWMASCDEAEQAIIGQCAMKAMTAANKTCMALWIFFCLAGMVFDIGFLPAAAVCVVWLVSQSVYSYWSMKLS